MPEQKPRVTVALPVDEEITLMGGDRQYHVSIDENEILFIRVDYDAELHVGQPFPSTLVVRCG